MFWFETSSPHPGTIRFKNTAAQTKHTRARTQAPLFPMTQKRTRPKTQHKHVDGAWRPECGADAAEDSAAEDGDDGGTFLCSVTSFCIRPFSFTHTHTHPTQCVEEYKNLKDKIEREPKLAGKMYKHSAYLYVAVNVAFSTLFFPPPFLPPSLPSTPPPPPLSFPIPPFPPFTGTSVTSS